MNLKLKWLKIIVIFTVTFSASAYYFADEASAWAFRRRPRRNFIINSTVNRSTVEPNPLIGDANKNGRVDIGDALAIAQYLKGSRVFDAEQSKAADVTSDGQITIDDANTIARYLVRKIKSLPIGALTISLASSSPTADVAVDATNQVLAIFDFTASGEDIKVRNLDVQANIVGGANGGIRNGKVLVDDVQVGATKNLTEATFVNFVFGSTFVIKAGTTAKVKIVGDIKAATSTDYTGGESVSITLGAGSSNIQGMKSLNILSRPVVDTRANALDIRSAALSVTKFSGFGDRTIAAGANDAQLASFVMEAGAVEGVSVNSITVFLSAVNANSATITRMYLKDHDTGDVLGSVKTIISTSNIYTINFNLAASGVKVVDLYGDIKAGANEGLWTAHVKAAGAGITTSKPVSAMFTDMQAITIGHGALTVANGAQPDSAILLAGSTGNHMAQFAFSAYHENFTIDKLRLKVPNNFATSAASISVKYKDKSGATQWRTGFLTFGDQSYAAATYTGLTLYVPANSSANLDVYVDIVSLDLGGASGAAGAITFDYDEGFNATGDSGTGVTMVGNADLTGNTFYVRKSQPTFVKLDAGDDPTVKLFRFSVTANGADYIDIKQLAFNIVTNGAVVASLRLYDDQGNALTDRDVEPTWINFSHGANVSLLIGGADNGALTIGATPRVFEIRGAVTGFNKAAGDSITISFQPDSWPTATASADAAGADGTFTANQGNIWSDRSARAHTTATADWTNGFLLKNMSGRQSF